MHGETFKTANRIRAKICVAVQAVTVLTLLLRSQTPGVTLAGTLHLHTQVIL